MPRKTVPNLVLPLAFDAEIYQIEDVSVIGDWLVGYTVWKEDDFGGPISPDPRLLQFLGANEGLTSALEAFLQWSTAPSPEKARRFLLKYGTFRLKDWHPIKKVLASGLPKEVLKEIQKLQRTPTEKVYVMREQDFWKEWGLLSHLVLLAGALADGSKPTSLRGVVSDAKPIIEDLRNTHILPLSNVQKRQSGPSTKSLDKFYAGNEDEPMDNASVQRSPKRQELPPGKKARRDLEDLLRTAFGRVVRQPVTDFNPNLDSGPGYWLGTASILGVCYLTLLASFSRRWKKCERPDCPNIFVVQGKKTKYCEWACGHLESVRRSRRLAKSAKGAKRKKKG